MHMRPHLAGLLLAASACAATPDKAPETPPATAAGNVRGVNPADNVTKIEILPKYTSLDSSSSISLWTTTLKFDRAIDGRFGLNLELPLATFSSPFLDRSGIGDINLRGRFQHTIGSWTFLTGAEAVLPTASDDVFGTGQFQLNPTMVAVKAFSARTFAACVAKHQFSFAGDRDRPEIVEAQFRIILGHTTPSGWWFLADPQLWLDYENGNRTCFAPEAEAGHMFGRSIGVWLRGGARLGGNWQRDDWNISGGIRFLSF